jgi:hypothetical protein
MQDDRLALDGAAERLARAIDRVQYDVEIVSFWACAFSGLVRPVPDYEIEGAVRLKSTPPPTRHTRIGINT